jgi:hypothetical protein
MNGGDDPVIEPRIGFDAESVLVFGLIQNLPPLDGVVTC